MLLRHLSVATLVAAFAAGSFPVVVLPTPASAENQECGYQNDAGKQVFLGTCPHGSSDGSNTEEQQAPTIPTPSDSDPGCYRSDTGSVFAYKLQLAC